MKRFILIATAALLIAAGGLIGCKKNESAQNTDNRTAGEKTRDALANAGEKTGEGLGKAVDSTTDAARTAGEKIRAATQPSADAAIKNTRSSLSSAVQAAVTHDGLDDLVGYFAKADRDRIGKLDRNTWGDLNTAIDKFRSDWKGKYNQDFKLSDKEQLVFGTPVQIQVGDLTGGARLASEQITPPTTRPSDSVNNITTVTFPAIGGAPLVMFRLLNEGTLMKSYKIDAPDSLDGNRLRDNLVTQINTLDAMKDQWPADANEAYRVASQHIFAAITDVK